MPYVETYYDYDIHRECFRVSDTASYTKTTDTLFQLTNTVSEVINYFTATFSIDVIRNLGNSKVGIYDNGQLLQLIDFNENTSRITNFNLRLNYNVEHNLEARYFGNDECLASKSKIVPLLVEMPLEFGTDIFTNTPTDGVIVNPSQNEEITIYLTDRNLYPIENASIKVYVDDNTTPVVLTTDVNGECVLSAPTHWTPSFGTHNIRILFETTSEYIGVEKELTLYIGYQATMTPQASKYIVGQVPRFNIETKQYDGTMIGNINVTLWR